MSEDNRHLHENDRAALENDETEDEDQGAVYNTILLYSIKYDGPYGNDERPSIDLIQPRLAIRIQSEMRHMVTCRDIESVRSVLESDAVTNRIIEDIRREGRYDKHPFVKDRTFKFDSLKYTGELVYTFKNSKGVIVEEEIRAEAIYLF